MLLEKFVSLIFQLLYRIIGVLIPFTSCLSFGSRVPVEDHAVCLVLGFGFVENFLIFLDLFAESVYLEL